MSRPEQVRRRSSRQAAAGRQLVLLTTCVVAAAAIGVGLVREAANPRFAVDIVAIRGLVHTSAPDVVTAAALQPGQNAWLVDRRAVATRIEALPWVGAVALHVSWPNRLAIDVSERKAVALVLLDAPSLGLPRPRYATIDDTQRVLALSDAADPGSQLPVLVVVPLPTDATPGNTLARPEVGQALDACGALRALGLQISEIAIAPSTGISATADRNLRVLFGEDEDLARKAQLFQAIVAKISTPSRVAYVDVRSVRAPTVLYR